MTLPSFFAYIDEHEPFFPSHMHMWLGLFYKM